MSRGGPAEDDLERSLAVEVDRLLNMGEEGRRDLAVKSVSPAPTARIYLVFVAAVGSVSLLALLADWIFATTLMDAVCRVVGSAPGCGGGG